MRPARETPPRSARSAVANQLGQPLGARLEPFRLLPHRSHRAAQPQTLAQIVQPLRREAEQLLWPGQAACQAVEPLLELVAAA